MNIVTEPPKNLSDSQRVEELARIYCKGQRKSIKKSRFFPKKNKSAYIFFTQEYKNEVIKTQPNVHLNSLMKEIAEKWARMGMDERKPYMKMAIIDKKRYFLEKRKVLDEKKREIFSDSFKKTNKKKKITPYLLFAKDVRKNLKFESPLMNPVEIMKEIGNRWKSLCDESRKPYYDLSEHMKKQSESQKTEEIIHFFESLRCKKRRKSMKNQKNYKKSAFLLFCDEKRLKSPEKSLKISDLAELWNSLSIYEKEKFHQKYQKSKYKFQQGDIEVYEEEKYEPIIMKNTQESEEIDDFLKDYKKFLDVKMRIGGGK